MDPLHQQAALLFAALLSERRDLNHRLRSSIIACARPVVPTSRDEVILALADAFRSVGLALTPRQYPREQAICRAAAAVDEWAQHGVFLVSQCQCRSPEPELHGLPSVWFAWGNRSVLDIPAAAVLNSRRPRNTSPNDEWIRTVKTMVHSARQRRFALASSYGTLGYSLVTFLAKTSPVLIACDHVLPFMASPEARSRFRSKYGDLFDVENTVFLSTFPPGRVPAKAERWVERDHLVAASASLLLIAEVRPGGHMERILEIAAKRNVPVETAHAAVPASPSPRESIHKRKTSKCSGEVTPSREPGSVSYRAAKPEVPIAEDFVQGCSYLVHYTRSCPGPWPGESTAQYCRALVEEHPRAAHTAFDTLCRILDQGTISASRRFTRGASAVVCFTELLPQGLSRLAVWRPGLLRWSFEPYGVAMRKQSLFRLGARPVIYAVETAFQDLAPELAYLFQLQKDNGTTWAEEREWRIIGDVALPANDPRDILVIVPTAEEARIIADTFGCAVALAAFETRRGGRAR